jgi:hypothetical protein
MVKEDIEEKIWTNKGEWTVENAELMSKYKAPKYCERNKNSKIGMDGTRG